MNSKNIIIYLLLALVVLWFILCMIYRDDSENEMIFRFCVAFAISNELLKKLD